MRVRQIVQRFAWVAPILLVSCSDGDPIPTAPAMDHMGHPQASVGTTSLEPFTYRGPLDPYKIQQLPDFMVHSKNRTDVVFQRLVFAPGAGPWHTHPGPSFVYVLQGQIKLDRFSKQDGCTATPVHGVGQVYFEEADQVHRAVVVSSESAVLLVTRFNIPVGGPITIMAADPGC